MASTSQQQIVSQSSVLFKFEEPSYSDYAGISRIASGLSDLGSISGITNDAGPTNPLAGLLGPTSKAPKLIPTSSAPIDIKSDFAWTSSKADPARADMPYVYLKEKIVDRSSRLQNLMYNTVSLIQSPLGIAAGAAIGAGAAAQFARNKGAGDLLTNVAKVGGAVVGGSAVSGLTNLTETRLGGDVYTNNLRAFSGLYSTTPTNFSYKLPFVKTTGSISKSISQSWNEESTTIGDSLEDINQKIEGLGGSTSAGGLAGTLSSGVELGSLLAKAADDVNNVVSSANKNVFAAAYTESAKTFGYGGKLGFEISFYLFNNLTWADTVKNWYAVFALQYQNLPNRLNRLILTPSVIYEAVVPGYFYSMYTYISNLDVSYIGSNLLIDIPILKTSTSDDAVRNVSNNQALPTNSNIRVVMPEVYKINITFESLVPESQNLLYEAMVQTRSNGSVPQAPVVGQFGSAGVGLTPGIPATSLGSIPLGF